MKFDLNEYYNNINNNVLISNSINQYYSSATIIDINKTNLRTLIKELKNKGNINNLLFVINITILDSYKTLKKIVKFISKLRVYIKHNSVKFIINLDNKELNDLTDELNNMLYNLIHSIIAINFNSKKEKYEYLYDIVCDYLDKQFSEHNLCDFKDGKCVANRHGQTIHKDNGCCYNVKYIGHLDFKVCGYCTKLSETGCTIKCISCKFFTCKYYKKQGISFEPRSIFLINTFFNKSQMLILKYNIYRTKEEIINKLLSDKLLPYFLSLATKNYYIKESDKLEKN